MEDKILITIDELSAYLRIPKPTLYTWTHMKKIPFIKIGRSVRFDKAEIDAWINGQKVSGLHFQGNAQEINELVIQ